MAISRSTMNHKTITETERFESLIDKEMEKHAGCFDKDGFINLIIRDEITKLYIRQQLFEKYYRVGWSTMIFKTSSENGERPGLTSIKMG